MLEKTLLPLANNKSQLIEREILSPTKPLHFQFTHFCKFALIIRRTELFVDVG